MQTVAVVCITACHKQVVTDYETELAGVETHIAELTKQSQADSVPEGTARSLIAELYRKSSLTALPLDIRAVGLALDRTGSAAGLNLQRAMIDLKLHNLPAARVIAASFGAGVEDSFVFSLKGDVAAQESRYADARQWYARALDRNITWDLLAKVADLDAQTGRWEEAARGYEAAADEISAREMRGYAWVELQHGLLDLQGGRVAEALKHYQKAEQAYSGYWLTADHLAEALACQGDFPAAIAQYARLLERVPRPELFHALGDLYMFTGKPALAREPYQKALQGYLDSVNRGEMLYYHHLAVYYSDSWPDSGEALIWARRDRELRPCAATHEALAWALHLHHEPAAAAVELDAALATGARSPHLWCRAAIVLHAAGRNAESERFHNELLRMNPGYETSFHVHR